MANNQDELEAMLRQKRQDDDYQKFVQRLRDRIRQYASVMNDHEFNECKDMFNI